MVLTRKSLNTTSDSPTTSSRRSSDGEPRAVSRELRKLAIDGNDALRGERDGKEEAAGAPRVYHWRGAVYMIDENTPEEWLAAQPKRYLKPPRLDGNDDIEEGSSRKRKRQEHDDHSSALRRRSAGRRMQSSPHTSSPRAHATRHLYTPRSRKYRQSSVEEQTLNISSHSSRQANPLTSGSQRKASRPGRPPSTGRSDNDVKQEHVPSVKWADMITSQIAVNITKFLAVQAQLRKTQQDYDAACDLHERVKHRSKSSSSNPIKASPSNDTLHNIVESKDEPSQDLELSGKDQPTVNGASESSDLHVLSSS